MWTQWGKRNRQTERVTLKHTHYHLQNRGSEINTRCREKLKLVLCDKLERWDRMGGGREVQKERDICPPM